MALSGGGFSNHVASLFNNPELSDVAIVLDNDEDENSSGETKTFYGHRVILATMSDYFRSMLFGSFVEATKKEIRLPGVPYTTFEKVMYFVYYGWTRLNAGTLEETVALHSLSRMLLLDSKMNSAFEKFMLRQVETVETWKNDLLKILALAFEWDMPLLKKACVANISEIANEFLANSSFLELPLGAVQLMLDTSPLFCTRAELEQAIQAWIDHHERDISADIADELSWKVSVFGKFCHNFKTFPLYRKKDKKKSEKPGKPLAECLEPMGATAVASHEYSYKSEMKIIKCFALKGIMICLEANAQFGPQYGRIKSEIKLCLNINSSLRPEDSRYRYSNSVIRNLTVCYDLTQLEKQSVTIYFPEMTCCKDAKVTFYFSWNGSGVQPLLHSNGPAEINKLFKTDTSYVTHIIYRTKDDYDSDGRCSMCPGMYDSDRCSSSSTFYGSNEEEEMESERSQNDSDED